MSSPDPAIHTKSTEALFHIYRIAKARYADDVTGTGARLYGGRWNSRGVPVVYASQYRSLCLLEMLVHASVDILPADLRMVTIRVPGGLPVYEVTTSQLPAEWRGYPYDSLTRDIGDTLLKTGKYALIRVPSAIVDEEWNWLIHPGFVAANGIGIAEIKPLYFDDRLIQNAT